MLCPMCDSVMSDDDSYCTVCGYDPTWETVLDVEGAFKELENDSIDSQELISPTGE
jgi:hypothetical protein